MGNKTAAESPPSAKLVIPDELHTLVDETFMTPEEILLMEFNNRASTKKCPIGELIILSEKEVKALTH